jgi:hypothetical protein
MCGTGLSAGSFSIAAGMKGVRQVLLMRGRPVLCATAIIR